MTVKSLFKSVLRKPWRLLRQPRAKIRHRPTRGVPTVRLGTEYGGRVIPARYLKADSICYCAGAGEDISFDLELVRRFGSSVWLFDPTPRAILHFEHLQEHTLAGTSFPINRDPESAYDVSVSDLSRLHYSPIGLWSADEMLKFYSPADTSHVSHSILNLQRTTSYLEVQVRRLKNVMNELGHDRIDLLKLDIEGAEITVLDTIIEDKLDIGVICSEYDEWHHPLDSKALDRINGSIRRMKRGGYALIDIDQECNVMYARKDLLPLLRAQPD